MADEQGAIPDRLSDDETKRANDMLDLFAPLSISSTWEPSERRTIVRAMLAYGDAVAGMVNSARDVAADRLTDTGEVDTTSGGEVDEADVSELDAFLAAYADEPDGDLVNRVENDDLLTWGILRRCLASLRPIPEDPEEKDIATIAYMMGAKDERDRAALATHKTADAGAMREPHVFLDCDGVLADFDTYAEAYFGMNPREYEKKMGSAAFWKHLEAKGDFYRNLPLMPDAMTLYEGVKHLHPTILTGCPRGDWAQGQKVAWAAEHFPGVPIITCRSADKRDYAKPGDVIIDDWPQHRHRWIEMGGVFIVHHDAASSLAALWAHYPALIRNLTGDGEPL